MGYTRTNIANLALGWMGANLILDIDDPDLNEARLCKVNYPFARDAVLEERDWTFACARRIIAPEQEVPAFEWGQQFLLPGECIRVRRVSDEPNFTNTSFQWEKEGRSILCNATQIYVKYIKRVEDPTLFSPNFAQAVAARLGMELCLPLSAGTETHKTLAGLYAVKLETAGTMDGMQGKNEKLQTGVLTRAR